MNTIHFRIFFLPAKTLCVDDCVFNLFLCNKIECGLYNNTAIRYRNKRV